MKKLLQKILKVRKTSVTTIFVNPIITEQWILFGSFTIYRTTKTL